MKKAERDQLLETLQHRFEANMGRHRGMDWKTVRSRLESEPTKLRVVAEMEKSGGEPDVVILEKSSELIQIVDCSPESPEGRRSLCFDDEAHRSRKANKPVGSALGKAAEMGVEILTESQYRTLQKFGEFDRKTSSWIATPASIRNLGGALFCDRRYDTIFLYHNGAESYYAARGFRALVTL